MKPILGWVLLMLFVPAWPVWAQEPTTSEEVLQWLEAHVPEAHSQVMALKREEPDEFREELEGVREQIAYIRSVRQQNPDLADRLIEAENLEFESWKLAEAIGETKDLAEKKQMKARLEEILGTIFDTRQAERALEIEMLQAEIKQIQALLEKRNAGRDKIIQRRTREMLEEFDESLEWW